MSKAGLALLFLVVLAALSALVNAQDELDFGIMIDAGSTGSRIYLYDWPHRENNTLPLVEPTINQTVVSYKINVPLSGFINNPEDAGQSLAPLVKYIEQNLNSSKWSTTPIYLKATAGMRALNLTMQEEIIASVQEYLATTPFLFNASNARVIPGTDEGIFGWITTNYALQVLQAGDNLNSYGALDMGGASTQFTFIPADKPEKYYFGLNLGYVDYNLYTYSYPLGQDASLNLFITSLITNKIFDPYGNVANPCYLLGYNETYNYLGTNFLIVGTGNFDLCAAYILKYVVVKNTSCSECGVGDVYQPPINGNYYAFSGFAYTYQFFDLENTSSIGDLQNATNVFCSTPWEEVINQNNGTAPQYLKFYCFSGSYFSDLLIYGYGFMSDSTNLVVSSSVGNIELTWALGGMIYEASLMPFGPPSNSSSSSEIY